MHERQLGTLMHRIAGGVPVRNDQTAAAVEIAPLGLVAGETVHRIEGGGRKCVDIIRLLAELAGQIHFYQCGGIALIIREGDLTQFLAALPQRAAQQIGLCSLAGAVQPLKDDQFTHG